MPDSGSGLIPVQVEKCDLWVLIGIKTRFNRFLDYVFFQTPNVGVELYALKFPMSHVRFSFARRPIKL